MKNEREQFEKLPDIEDRLRVGDVYWNEKTQSYKSTGGSHRRATYINGAWYAFQEQQKKIDNLEKLVDRIYSANEDSEIKSIIDGWDN